MKYTPKSDVSDKQGRTTSAKSKVKSFPFIRVALQTADFGTIFTTPQSDDIYVITHGSWGAKSANKLEGFPKELKLSTVAVTVNTKGRSLVGIQKTI